MRAPVVILVLVVVLMVGSIGLVPEGSSQDSKGDTITFPRTTLLELFTGTWCGNCPGAEGSVHRLLQEYSLNQLAVVEYHSRDNYTPIDSLHDDRKEFYDVVGYPQAWFSGENSTLGGSDEPMNDEVYNDYKQKVEADQNKTSPIAISLDTKVVSDKLYVTVYIVAANKPLLHNLSLGTILVYDENWIDGKFIIRFTGVQWIANQNIELSDMSMVVRSYSVTLREDWKKSKLYVVSYVQTRDKHKVYQDTFTWYEAEVLNSAIQPINKWELIPQRSAISVNVSEPYTLSTVVKNELNTTKEIKVGYDPTTVPQGWDIKIAVDNQQYTKSDVNITLNPGESKNVYYIVNATTEDTAYLKIYAEGSAQYSDIHYIIVDSTGQLPIPELNWIFIGPFSAMVAIVFYINRKTK